MESDGIAIPGEIYEMTEEQYNDLIVNEPPDMYESPIDLDTVSAMLYPEAMAKGWPDVSDLGGWAAYKADQI